MEKHIEIVKLTSKGQLVIPQEIREELKLKEGDKLMLLKENGTVLLKPVKQMGREVEEELADMKLAAERFAEIESGKYKRYNKAEFLKELAKW